MNKLFLMSVSICCGVFQASQQVLAMETPFLMSVSKKTASLFKSPVNQGTVIQSVKRSRPCDENVFENAWGQTANNNPVNYKEIALQSVKRSRPCDDGRFESMRVQMENLFNKSVSFKEIDPQSVKRSYLYGKNVQSYMDPSKKEKALSIFGTGQFVFVPSEYCWLMPYVDGDFTIFSQGNLVFLDKNNPDGELDKIEEPGYYVLSNPLTVVAIILDNKAKAFFPHSWKMEVTKKDFNYVSIRNIVLQSKKKVDHSSSRKVNFR